MGVGAQSRTKETQTTDGATTGLLAPSRYQRSSAKAFAQTVVRFESTDGAK